MKKIIALVNHWSDTNEYLEEHCKMLRDCGVSFVYVLTQITSNQGIKDNSGLALCIELRKQGIINDYLLFVPNLSISASQNEKHKRMAGLNYAKTNDYDYVILTDTDEFYKVDEFKGAYNYLENFDHVLGLVFPIYTYYKRRTLRTEGFDNYFVAGLYKIREDITLERSLKFYCDPTRRLNYRNTIAEDRAVQVYLQCPMHHYSWIRENIEMKIENSSAKANIKANKMYQTYLGLEVGSLINGQKLIEVQPN